MHNCSAGKFQWKKYLETVGMLEDMSIVYTCDSNCIQLAPSRVQLRTSMDTAINISYVCKQLYS